MESEIKHFCSVCGRKDTTLHYWPLDTKEYACCECLIVSLNDTVNMQNAAYQEYLKETIAEGGVENDSQTKD